MTFKSDVKFEEKLTCCLENDVYSKVSKLELWWGPFVQSRKCMGLKFTEKLCGMTVKNDAKIEEKLTCRFKTDMRNFTNFDPNTWKSKARLLVTKVYIVWATKVQRSFLSWHRRVMQNLKEKWLVLLKMTCGISQICIGWNKWITNLTKLFTHVYQNRHCS